MPDDKPPINLDDIDFGHTIRGHQKGDRVFERFVLKKLLGRGGMGVVWLAADERLGREVALKFAPEAIRYDDLAVEELKEETRKGLNLAHPNIVKIYDFLLDEEHAAISMEFIDGENLGALRARQPNKVFEARQLAHWVNQLLDALDYAHRGARVIHRDLKPANLMIDREGNLRVTDFGIARSISDALSRATLGAGNSTGTLAYMSPQQADGKKPHITDDLYAFGSTLYELLTGKPPFFSGNIAHQLRDEPVTGITDRRREFEIHFAEPVPVEWEQTVLSCLEKSVEARPPTAAVIRQRLGLGPAPAVHVPGPSPAQSGATTSTSAFGDTLTSHPTSHTQIHVRAHAGLTEVDAPGRPIMAGNVRVNPATTSTAPSTDVPSQGKSRSGLIIGLVLALLLMTALGGGTWLAVRDSAWLASFRSPVAAANPPALTPRVSPDVPPADPPVQPPPPTPSRTRTIQAAINEAKPGATVLIPAGIYEEQLRFKEGIILKAAEAGKVIVQTDGKLGSSLLVENCDGGSIHGFVFQHTGTEVADKVNWPVVLIKSSSVTLEECTVLAGVGDGALITGAGKPQVLRCAFKNNARIGLIMESGTTGMVTGCEARKNGESGVEVRMLGTHPTIKSCTLSENGGSGLVVKDGGSASVLESTTCKGNGEAGIAAIGEGVSLVVVKAVIEDNLWGISTQMMARAQISECTISDSQMAGLHFDQAADGSEALNNTISKCTLEGIMAGGTAGGTLSIVGNKCLGNAGSGIGIFGEGFKPTVERNDCLNNGQHGILAVEGVSGIIRDNTVRGNHLAAIKKEGAAPDLLIQGNLTDSPGN